MARKPNKSETLTIRLDPKIRFMLDYVARVRGQTITTVVERAITESANSVKLRSDEFSEEGWRDLWSVVDGERALNIAAEPLLHPTFEEEKTLAFARKHWPFFFVDRKINTPRTSYIEILWPRIEEFVALDDEKKSSSDYWAAGKAMQKALTEVNVQPPDWPTKPAPEPKNKTNKSAPKFDSPDDDDIPF